ncbi:sensor histidine kinase [Alkalicoccobacillus murimartini]|uniref:histidine kinase n=1 Tax=Alkalicoccobacillus murimartini TaxID=171685 RepID=A0ABT9YLN2_9BACI|nr:HAMP domain-containing sensor histidine kinase [Alkalicoccobacillus murimartini]MDQ0208395.1 signal transduction histidine kinase [Alkalicoccobacillus murimartini]
MLRDKEVQRFLLILLIVTCAGISAAYFVSTVALFIVLATSILLVGAFFMFTIRRYKQIERLSEYLRSIAAGNYSLDVRDNEEGELSILKNELYRVTTMLSEQSADLSQEKGKLTDAISDISHQLKTPLTSMTVMADLLSESSITDEKRVEFARHILVQLERMEWLVTSLLKLSKMDAGTIEFKKQSINVQELLEKAVQPLLIPIELKNQTLQVEQNEHVHFIGDFHWSIEAIVNLLKNAVEHTPNDGIISISFSENILYTEIKIKDNGNGISKEDLPYIFNRFYKGKQAKEGSVGIGLALVHRIISSQNGDIEVNSDHGESTVFSIKFYKRLSK